MKCTLSWLQQLGLYASKTINLMRGGMKMASKNPFNNKNTRILTVFNVIIALILAGLACAILTGVFDFHRDVYIKVETNKDIYEYGENVMITFILVNDDDEKFSAETVDYIVDFIIYSESGREAINTTKVIGRNFTKTVEVDGNSQKVLSTFTWNQTELECVLYTPFPPKAVWYNHIAPGNYTISAILGDYNGKTSIEGEKRIEIRNDGKVYTRIETEKDVYKQGEYINITFILVNDMDVNFTYICSNDREWDIIILDSNGTAVQNTYNWWAKPAWVVYKRMSPHSEKIIGGLLPWDQTNSTHTWYIDGVKHCNGVQVPPGEYRIRGIFVGEPSFFTGSPFDDGNYVEKIIQIV